MLQEEEIKELLDDKEYAAVFEKFAGAGWLDRSTVSLLFSKAEPDAIEAVCEAFVTEERPDVRTGLKDCLLKNKSKTMYQRWFQLYLDGGCEGLDADIVWLFSNAGSEATATLKTLVEDSGGKRAQELQGAVARKSFILNRVVGFSVFAFGAIGAVFIAALGSLFDGGALVGALGALMLGTVSLAGLLAFLGLIKVDEMFEVLEEVL